MLNFKKKNSQNGQAAVEYLLILAITVGIIVGLANQFYKPFGAWSKNYFGEYLECLLDYGELPTLGSENITSECNGQFKKFSFKEGRPAITRNRERTARDLANRRTSNGISRGGDVTSGGPGTRGTSRSFNTGGSSVGADSYAEVTQDKEKQVVPSSEYLNFRNKNTSVQTIANSSISIENKRETTLISRSPNQPKKPPRENVTLELDGNGDETKAKKFIIKPPERKVSNTEDAENWDFSSYLKLFVIAAIIIAIVLFLAGQFSQISKSMEK